MKGFTIRFAFALLMMTLAALAVSAPKLDRGREISSGSFDSNSDCVVLGDELTYRTPADLLDGILGGHGRGFSTLTFNEAAYRIVFSSRSDEARLVRVSDCEVHLGGEPFRIDGYSVDTSVLSRRGRVVVDRVPDRGYGPASRLIVRVPWERTYEAAMPGPGLDDFQSAAPLFDARVLIRRPMAEGQDITYDIYDYARARRLQLRIPRSLFPRGNDETVRLKATPDNRAARS